MRFASLGSGSEGNALLVASSRSKTTIMVDCGFAVREVERRLRRFDLAPADISAIFVTHEHSDHVGGVFKLARRFHIPVWLSQGTFDAVRHDTDGVNVRFCRDSDQLAIGDLNLYPYTVPHDAREPLQCVIDDGQRRLGVLTDAGHATPHMIAALSACDALFLEFNHDLQMLADSSYPAFLKRRISGDHGHLSNVASAEILAALDKQRLKTVVAAHLSRTNNTPELALEAMREAVTANALIQLHLASQDLGFDWLEVGN
jgi:phosphoribosyl 1,2-cyclic phosphodiesterase